MTKQQSLMNARHIMLGYGVSWHRC